MSATLSITQRLKSLVLKSNEKTIEDLDKIAAQVIDGTKKVDESLGVAIDRIGSTPQALDEVVARIVSRRPAIALLKTMPKLKEEVAQLETEYAQLDREEAERRAAWVEENYRRYQKLNEKRTELLREGGLRDVLSKSMPPKLKAQISALVNERRSFFESMRDHEEWVSKAREFVRHAESKKQLDDVDRIKLSASKSDLALYGPRLEEMKKRYQHLTSEIDRVSEEALFAE